MKKILNLFSLFFAVIGLCTVTLICHIIFIYPNLNSNDSAGIKNIAMTPTGDNSLNTTALTDNYPYNTPLPDITQNNNILPDYQETESSPSDIEHSISDDTDIPAEYSSALNKANDYSNTMYMSKTAIYNQLVSEYGEHFSPEAAQYAIDNIVADWNSNALQKAKNYSDTMYMSKASIYDQLISEYGENFTSSEAQYAIDNLVADYNFNALQKAKDYQNTMNMSPDAIRDQLTSEYGEKFTQEEADYALANIEPARNDNNNSVRYTAPIEQSGSNDYTVTTPVQTMDPQTSNSNFSGTYSTTESQDSTPIGDMVWLSATGEKYHSINNCGRMNPDKATSVSLEYAISQGYEKCEKCF